MSVKNTRPYKVFFMDTPPWFYNAFFYFSLSMSQYVWLRKVQITKVFDLWRKFIQLVEDGWFDFCTLPYGAKQLMNLPDEDVVRQIPAHYSGM